MRPWRKRETSHCSFSTCSRRGLYFTRACIWQPNCYLWKTQGTVNKFKSYRFRIWISSLQSVYWPCTRLMNNICRYDGRLDYYLMFKGWPLQNRRYRQVKWENVWLHHLQVLLLLWETRDCQEWRWFQSEPLSTQKPSYSVIAIQSSWYTPLSVKMCF